jgi:serine/threonine protein kinase
VAIHDILVVEGHPALVMEWVRGETLRDRLRREGALPWREAAAVGDSLLQALVHLHGLGIIHRDLKSGNILLGEGEVVKLADFGLAKGEDLGMSLTVTGVSLGTPGYMAPEVIRGKEATALSDLYSLGAVFYEMLAGRTPFVGVSSFEVASRQLSEPAPLAPPKERKLPRWLVSLVTRLLEREARDRFHSAKAALAALRKRSPGFTVARRWRVRAALLAGLALLAASLIGLRQWSSRRAPLNVAFHGRTIEARDSSGAVLWRREMPRDAALTAQFDEVLAKARKESATVVETRALLPLTLARAAAIHRAAGQRTEAARLQAEALRLAPAAWAPLLHEIAESR